MDQRRHISLRAFVGQPMWKVVATSAHTTMTLVVSSVQRLTLGDRAFAVAASRAWNSLPPAQWRRQELKFGGGGCSPSPPFPPSSFLFPFPIPCPVPSLPFSLSPSLLHSFLSLPYRNRIWCILALKSDIWWQYILIIFLRIN